MAAVGAKPAHRPTGSALPTVGSPLGSGLGVKLPPPKGGAAPRPVASASGGRATATARALESGVDIDPSSMLETPAPQLHMLHGHGGTNGVGHSASAQPPATATRSSSDVLNLLNLPGAPQGQAGSAPRLMSSPAAIGWSPSVEAPATRARNAKLVFGLLGVVAVICVVLAWNATKRRDLPPVPAPKATVTDPLAGVVEKMAAPEPPRHRRWRRFRSRRHRRPRATARGRLGDAVRVVADVPGPRRSQSPRRRRAATARRPATATPPGG